MLNIEVDLDKDTQKIHTAGDLATILTEIAFTVNQIYNGFLRNEPETADFFKHAFISAVNCGLPFVRTKAGENETLDETFFAIHKK